jgi:cytochrome c1
MSRRTLPFALAAVLLALLLPAPLPAAPVPSRDRAADLAVVHDVLAKEDVARALSSSGLKQAQIETRLAQLSDEEVASLAANLDQVQAGGAMDRNTMWIVIYILAGILLIVLLT